MGFDTFAKMNTSTETIDRVLDLTLNEYRVLNLLLPSFVNTANRFRKPSAKQAGYAIRLHPARYKDAFEGLWKKGFVKYVESDIWMVDPEYFIWSGKYSYIELKILWDKLTEGMTNENCQDNIALCDPKEADSQLDGIWGGIQGTGGSGLPAESGYVHAGSDETDLQH